MAQQKTESKNQNKRNNETVKHVQLERKRPKLSKVNGSKQGNNKSNNQNKKNNNRRPKQNQTKRDPKATLRIIPLGGLDAIGKNMTVFECKNDMVLDDAGLMFPDDDHPGIDLILPDYTYVLENADKLRGIIITHGHEDHTGALPYLLKDLEASTDLCDQAHARPYRRQAQGAQDQERETLRDQARADDRPWMHQGGILRGEPILSLMLWAYSIVLLQATCSIWAISSSINRRSMAFRPILQPWHASPKRASILCSPTRR